MDIFSFEQHKGAFLIHKGYKLELLHYFQGQKWDQRSGRWSVSFVIYLLAATTFFLQWNHKEAMISA